MADFGVTENGFSRKRVADVKDETEDKFRDGFGEGIKVGPKTVFGVLIAIISAIIASVWEMAGAVYSMLDPDEAEEDQLEALAGILGLTKIAATPSLVELTLSGDPGTTIPEGTRIARSDDSGIEFESVRDTDIDSNGDGAVVARSVDTGPVEAPSGTLTDIVTPVTGLDSVTNDEDAEIGQDVETDEELRLRMKTAPAVAGGGTVDSIYAGLLEVFGVTTATVIENDTTEVDADGRPPHSIEAVVSGGEPEDIADLLWQKKPGSSRIVSTADGSDKVHVVVVDSQGYDRDIYFTRPEQVEIYVSVDVATVGGFALSSGELDAVKSAVAQAAAGYEAGTDVRAWRLQEAVSGLSFIRANTERIEAITLAVDTAPDPAGNSVAISNVQVADFDSTRIEATQS